jgi:hypothetical protein
MHSPTARFCARRWSAHEIAYEEAASHGRKTRAITARNLAMDHPSVSAARRAFTSCLSRSIPGGEKAGLSRRLLTIACLRLFPRTRSKPNELYIVPLGERESISTPWPRAQLDLRRKSLQRFVLSSENKHKLEQSEALVVDAVCADRAGDAKTLLRVASSAVLEERWSRRSARLTAREGAILTSVKKECALGTT